MNSSEIVLQPTVSVKFQKGEVRLNNLLYQLRKFMNELYFGLLEEIFQALEKEEIQRLKSQFPGRYVKNGRRHKPRQIKTSYGVFRYNFAVLYDKKKGRTCTPLPQEIGLQAYARNSREIIQDASGLVCHLSYRKSSQEVQRIMGTEISKSTLHRALQDVGRHIGPWPDLKKIPYRYLMVDGTGIRLQGTDKKAEMRWALASMGEKHKFELVGIWIETPWSQIRKDLEKRLQYSRLEVLFADGEGGIHNQLLTPGMRLQRCLWHGKREFTAMLFMDGIKKIAHKQCKDKLSSIPAMTMTKEQLESIDPADAPQIKETIRKSEEGFEQLLDILDKEKYPRARRYIERLSENVTTFFDIWLSQGECIPLTTNIVESAFSQVKNRIWSIGKRWSKEGLMNWLKVVVKKVFYPETWDKLWKEYLGLESNIQIQLRGIKCQWV